jgi:hypothetical protein
MDRKLALLGTLLVALATSLGGCVIYDSGATAIIRWDFAGQTCAEAGVHTVTFEIEEYGSDFFDSFEASCATGEVIIEDLTPDTYFIHVDGLGGSFLWHKAADVDLHGGDNELNFHLEAIESH